MTAQGGPTTWQLEVSWDGSTWTDETAYLSASDVVTVARGRASEADDAQPGVLKCTLDNVTGRFTPDNPLSPLFPLVRDGARCRFTVTRGGTSSVRHRGRITLGEPDLPGGELAQATVQVTSVDVLGQLARRRLGCDFVERWLTTSSTYGIDLWPLDETAARPSTLRNVGVPANPGRVAWPASMAGTLQQTAPDWAVLDASIDLAPTGGIGPVLVLPASVPAGQVLDLVVPFRTSERVAAGGADRVLLSAYMRNGQTMFQVRLQDNGGQTDINLVDGSGLFLSTLRWRHAAIGADSGDEQGLLFRMVYTGGATYSGCYRISDQAAFSYDLQATLDVRQVAGLILGASMSPRLPGKQASGAAASFGAVVISSAVSGHGGYLQPRATEGAQTRVADVARYAGVTAGYTGTESRTVTLKPVSGRTPFEALVEVARTVGAVITADTSADDQLAWIDSDQLRSTTVALTVDVEQDADGTQGLPWVKDAIPSRVSASWPGGQVVVQDATQAVVVDGSVDTCAASPDGAADVAASRVYASRRLRLAQLRVDVAGASNDLWSAVMALKLGDRVRTSIGTAGSLLAGHYGFTYVDGYAAGWVEAYAEGLALWTVDLTPADPVEAVFDTARFAAEDGAMTVTSGSAVGGTSTGTIVVTTAGPTFSTDSADYPVDLDWNGERVTVTSAPAGGSSPQTLTVTARGVAPTIARAHSAGEPITVADAAAWTM